MFMLLIISFFVQVYCIHPLAAMESKDYYAPEANGLRHQICRIDKQYKKTAARGYLISDALMEIVYANDHNEYEKDKPYCTSLNNNRFSAQIYFTFKSHKSLVPPCAAFTLEAAGWALQEKSVPNFMSVLSSTFADQNKSIECLPEPVQNDIKNFWKLNYQILKDMPFEYLCTQKGTELLGNHGFGTWLAGLGIVESSLIADGFTIEKIVCQKRQKATELSSIYAFYKWLKRNSNPSLKETEFDVDVQRKADSYDAFFKTAPLKDRAFEENKALLRYLLENITIKPDHSKHPIQP